MNPKVHPARPKILCIDDDPAVTTTIRQCLGCYEVDVLTAANGTDGMWTAMNELPDVIITDLRMPDKDGDYVVECLKGRADTDEIPVIALSGRASNEAQSWMQTLGVKHHLSKPLQIDKILAALDDYIELRPACHEHIPNRAIHLNTISTDLNFAPVRPRIIATITQRSLVAYSTTPTPSTYSQVCHEQ